MVTLSGMLRKAASVINSADIAYWDAQLKSRFGLDVRADEGTANPHLLFRQLYYCFMPIPPALVRDCGITDVLFRSDMGPNRRYSPNHGYFQPGAGLVALNADCFWHPDQPDDFVDAQGYQVSRAVQTAVHEFGHGFDDHFGDLSLKPDWTKLSGWSETPQPGLIRLRIKESDSPEVIGEWCYDPKSEFTRFYGKRNPWDDWADCFAFYVGGVRGRVPATKRAYFDKLLAKYYK